MTDGGAIFQPGDEEVTVQFRPRSRYAGYRAFGTGDDAVLLRPQIAHQLRLAAESATQEGRITGGLLYGRGWVDDDGAYLVVDGFLESGPGENSGDRLYASGEDYFQLSEADLLLLREDAARMYSGELEVGWWRSRGSLGPFGPRDFDMQAALVGPDGVGLLIYGSGPHWGTAYLGPDGLAPDAAGTLVATVPDPNAAASSGYDPAPAASSGYDPAAAPAADPSPAYVAGPAVAGAAADGYVDEEIPASAVPPEQAAVPPPRTTAPPRQAAPPPGAAGRAPRQTRGRAVPRVRMPARVRTIRTSGPAAPGYAEQPTLPTDVTLVVGLLALAIVAVAIIIGVLVHSLVVGLVIAVVGVLAVVGSVWMSRR